MCWCHSIMRTTSHLDAHVPGDVTPHIEVFTVSTVLSSLINQAILAATSRTINMAHLTREEVLRTGEVAPEYRKVRMVSTIAMNFVVTCSLQHFTDHITGLRSPPRHAQGHKLHRIPHCTRHPSRKAACLIPNPWAHPRVRH
jgi:hypothetical protein